MTQLIIIALLFAIVIALASGLFFLVRDTSNKTRTVRALTWRIGLSLTLILVLVIGYFTGWIQPHNLQP